jgi:ferrochelatase
MTDEKYQAVLLVSFGGPEGPDDVMPFLENVLRGRKVPRERMLAVAEHYQHFGGVSPINAQNRALIDALQTELNENGPQLPIYFGNRNWHPLLADTLEKMKGDGITKALALMTSGFSCYSGCRQYREDIMRASEAMGAAAPQIDKLRVFYNHPGFIAAMADRVREARESLKLLPSDRVRLVFTAHSIPLPMAQSSDYVKQLTEASRLVSQTVEQPDWVLVYQSRSGAPHQPWLEPDICDYLSQVHQQKSADHVVIVPIGFVSDHMEVVYDLDTEARELCDRNGLSMARAKTVGTHPKFVRALRDLIAERVLGERAQAIGNYPANHDVCPLNCCPALRPTAAK